MSAKILVVADDDVDMRTLLASRLRRRGYEVIEVADGVELLGYLRSTVQSWTLDDEEVRVPSAIISDVTMPGLNGFDVIEDLRRDGCHIPVILITGLETEETNDKAARWDAMVCTKPFDIFRFCSTVDEVVGASG
ncbi:response regulator [Labilithrix luteola]|nr:response regulator [Labilithrix luteola]